MRRPRGIWPARTRDYCVRATRAKGGCHLSLGPMRGGGGVLVRLLELRHAVLRIYMPRAQTKCDFGSFYSPARMISWLHAGHQLAFSDGFGKARRGGPLSSYHMPQAALNCSSARYNHSALTDGVKSGRRREEDALVWRGWRAGAQSRARSTFDSMRSNTAPCDTAPGNHGGPGAGAHRFS